MTDFYRGVMSWDGVDRRHKPIEKERLFIVTVIGNIVLWVLFTGALILLHYARPEFITGLQEYWNIPGREHWLSEPQNLLKLLLISCIGLSLILIGLNSRRNRRKKDNIAFNVVFLLIVSIIAFLAVSTAN